MNISGDASVLDCFLKKPFRKYMGSTTKHVNIKLPFYYRCVEHSSHVEVDIWLPAKVNPAYSLMELWHYNKFNRKLLSQVMQGVYLHAGGHLFTDVVTGEVCDMGGYAFVEAGGVPG
jgi:hypothetical protein